MKNKEKVEGCPHPKGDEAIDKAIKLVEHHYQDDPDVTVIHKVINTWDDIERAIEVTQKMYEPGELVEARFAIEMMQDVMSKCRKVAKQERSSVIDSACGFMDCNEQDDFIRLIS